jgi:hypothetical protein
MFSGSLSAGLAGLTVSPSRGLFIFSPVMLVAAAGAIKVWRAPLTGDSGMAAARVDVLLLARYSALAVLAILLTYSKFIVWWGGHGYGPRYLTDAMPFAGLLLGFGFLPGPAVDSEPPVSARPLRFAAVLLAVSIVVQGIGAFCWPSPWTLDNNPPYRYRLWDWRNNEISACLAAGPRIDPIGRRLLSRVGLYDGK